MLQGTFNCTQKRGALLHFPNTDFRCELQLANIQLQVTTSLYFSAPVIPPEFTVDLISLQHVFSGSRSIAGSADRCFQGRWLLGNKSAEIPNLNGALHSITGRSNCNRKAIITYSSSGRERLFAQWFLAIAADYGQLQFSCVYPSTIFFLCFLRAKPDSDGESLMEICEPVIYGKASIPWGNCCQLQVSQVRTSRDQVKHKSKWTALCGDRRRSNMHLSKPKDKSKQPTQLLKSHYAVRNVLISVWFPVLYP